MFETLPQHAQHPQPFRLFQQQSPHFHTPWMPASPSPLGSCNANIPRAAIFSSKMGGSGTNNQTATSTTTTTTGKENHVEGNTQNIFSSSTSSSSSPRQSTFEQRFKSSSSSRPFARIFGSSSSEGGTAASARANKHRTLFLNKVKQGRETSRFNARGESVMMMEHLSEQKDWRETMQRKADAIYQQYHLEEGEVSGDDDDVVDCEQYALEMQEQEMEALLENMPADNNNNSNSNGLTSPAKSVRSFCDDEDEELEELFDQLGGDYSQDMDMSV